MPFGAQVIFVASNGPYDFLDRSTGRPTATASIACA